jgi:hypothetical protein
MKRIFSVLLLVTLFTSVGFACDIKFVVIGDKQATYKAGNEVIVETTVKYTHRVCELELSDTKFTAEGMKILGATPWKETAPGTYTRQIKLQILSDSAKQGVLNVVRSCKKEGGFGSFTLPKE